METTSTWDSIFGKGSKIMRVAVGSIQPGDILFPLQESDVEQPSPFQVGYVERIRDGVRVIHPRGTFIDFRFGSAVQVARKTGDPSS